MQKREQNKQGGGGSARGGGGGGPPAKRGRPFGSGSNSAAAAAVAAAIGDSIAPSTLLRPSLQVHSAFAGKFRKMSSSSEGSLSSDTYLGYSCSDKYTSDGHQ